MNHQEIYNALFSGTIDSVNLPGELDLSSLGDDMERLWRKSVANMANDVVIEYAATIVLKDDGTLALTNEISGDSFEVTPVPCVEAGEMFVGTFHTHPRTDGLMPMPFSADDFVSAIFFRENLSLLRSGELILALVRTEKSVANIAVADANRIFQDVFQRELVLSGRILTAVWKGNIKLCEKCGFALYAGRAEELLREVYRP